jgi:hypothetical protein
MKFWKKNWKLIIANKPYIVIKYTPPGFISDFRYKSGWYWKWIRPLSGTLVINLIKQLDKDKTENQWNIRCVWWF